MLHLIFVTITILKVSFLFFLSVLSAPTYLAPGAVICIDLIISPPKTYSTELSETCKTHEKSSRTNVVKYTAAKTEEQMFLPNVRIHILHREILIALFHSNSVLCLVHCTVLTNTSKNKIMKPVNIDRERKC